MPQSKAPKSKATLGSVARLPAGDAGELFEVFYDAAIPVLSDENLWMAETQRVGATPLPWPFVDAPGGNNAWPQLVQRLAASLVDVALHAIHTAHGEAIPEDPEAADFQVILRVAARASSAGADALVARFGGAGRISIKRDVENYLKWIHAEEAIRSGLPRKEAFERAGISRQSAYRALKRRK